MSRFSIACTAAVAALLGVAPAALAGTVERTLRCTTELQGGLPLLKLEANAAMQQSGNWFPADTWVSTGMQVELLAFHSSNKQYTVDGARCERASAVLPMSATGMPRVGVVHRGDRAWLRVRCFVGGSVLVRVRMLQDAAARPVAAKLTVQAPGRGRLVYLDWSRNRVTLWAAKRCVRE